MITFGDLKTVTSQVLSTSPDPRIDVEGIINNAGRYLFTMHRWRWRDRPQTPLNYIAPITLTDATYTETGIIITKTSAFSSYTYRGAEQLDVTGGANATEGLYVVAGKTDSSNITLSASIGSAADGDTDIDGEIEFPYCVLPSDFGEGEIVNVQINGNGYTKAIPTSLSTLRSMRQNTWLITDWQVYYAPVYASQLSSAVSPADPLLEIYPTPTAAEVGALLLTYKSGWATMSDEDAVANVPAGYEYILSRLVKAFSQEASTGSNAGILEVRASPELLDLKRADGGTQGNLGRIEGGAARNTNRQSWQSYTTISNP